MRPSFSSSRVTRTWSPSRTKAETPFGPGVSGSVRAKSSTVPREAAVRDPLLGAGDRPAVPVCDGGRAQRAGIRAGLGLGQREGADRLAARERRDEPAALLVGAEGEDRQASTALVCTATVTPTPASARESSSSTRMYERKSAPAPPYSSGMQTPMQPELGQLAEQLAREAVLAVPRRQRSARSPPARTRAPAPGSPAGRR